MSTIIAGRFETQAAAESALRALADAGFQRDEYGSFYLTAPGQHSTYPIGGDAHHDEGAKHAGNTAAAGGAIGAATGLALGTAVGAALEPSMAAVGAMAGAGVGAYTGSLVGGLSGTRSGDPSKASVEEPVERPAGIMVSVCVDRSGIEDKAIGVLREHGALDLERATGEWKAGEWIDFDPRKPARLITPT